MDIRDQARRERNRSTQLENQVGLNPTRGESIVEAQVCKTISNGFAYPATAGVFFWVQPLAATGPEVVNTPPTLSPSRAPFLAAHIGVLAPPVGSTVIVEFSLTRFFFEY